MPKFAVNVYIFTFQGIFNVYLISIILGPGGGGGGLWLFHSTPTALK